MRARPESTVTRAAASDPSAPAGPTPPLEVIGLRKVFGRREAVHEVSFTVPPRSVTGLLGPNGSGKSTTLHCITGFHEPTDGLVLIGGHPHDRIEAKDVFGFFPDDLPVPEALTATETLAFHRRLRPRFDPDTAEQWLHLMGLHRHREKLVGEYSHGMRRKLQLVLALAHHPRLLILDEPMRGLDPEAGALMTSVLLEFVTAGGSVLVATHDLYAAERLCDQVVVLEHGRVLVEGSPSEVMAGAGADTLESAFISLTGLHTPVHQARVSIRALLGGDEAVPTPPPANRSHP